MLKNEYLDAKIGVDTEENEPSKVFILFDFHTPRDLIFTYVYRPAVLSLSFLADERLLIFRKLHELNFSNAISGRRAKIERA